MNLLHVVILAVVQGLAELLPVSSSAHVIVVEKLLGLDPTTPAATLLLVMLHTGTMLAVIFYFWRAWKKSFFASRAVFVQQAARLLAATALTATVGMPLKWGIERLAGKDEIEMLFGNLGLMAAALTAGGVLIIVAGLTERRMARDREVGLGAAAWMGAVQGLCLPFRGFSRSGATISTGLLLGAVKARVEEFSFALAVILTPAVVHREVGRLIKAQHEAGSPGVTWGLFAPSLLGMVLAFLAGLLALRWLSRWLEGGRWYLFGVYCLLAAAAVLALYSRGL
jgi:undecaprenyl-diphosphatase